ncbi:hypothetical protein DPMN_176157, partial [Dreissena polymorpha]
AYRAHPDRLALDFSASNIYYTAVNTSQLPTGFTGIGVVSPNDLIDSNSGNYDVFPDDNNEDNSGYYDVLPNDNNDDNTDHYDVLPDDVHDDCIVIYAVVPLDHTEREATPMYTSPQITDDYLHTGLPESSYMITASFKDNFEAETHYPGDKQEKNGSGGNTDFEFLENDTQREKNKESGIKDGDGRVEIGICVDSDSDRKIKPGSVALLAEESELRFNKTDAAIFCTENLVKGDLTKLPE